MFREMLTALLPRQERPSRNAFKPRRRLTFESLETRAVPAALIDTGTGVEPICVNEAGDEVGAPGLTLREAIAQAQSTPEDDTIVFAEGISAINLSQGELQIGYLFMPPDSGALTIDGGVDVDGNPMVTIDAGGQSGVMEIQSGTVILTGLTLTNGNDDLGGGLMIWDGSNVTLENVHVVSNTATNAGGGIFNGGVLAMTNTVVSNNYARGGGGGVYIYGDFGGSLTATGSTFSNNEARSAGGGIYNSGGGLMLIDSTVSHNLVTRGDGGGIYNSGEDVTLVGTTVESNTARNGGGIYHAGGSLDVSGGNSFTGNQASGNGNDLYYTVGDDVSGIDGLDFFEAALKGKGGGRK